MPVSVGGLLRDRGRLLLRDSLPLSEKDKHHRRDPRGTQKRAREKSGQMVRSCRSDPDPRRRCLRLSGTQRIHEAVQPISDCPDQSPLCACLCGALHGDAAHRCPRLALTQEGSIPQYHREEYDEIPGKTDRQQPARQHCADRRQCLCDLLPPDDGHGAYPGRQFAPL